MRLRLITVTFLVAFLSCQKKVSLHPVSVSDFRQFVLETGYQTDAEQYGWSIVQHDVFQYTLIDGANWTLPNGVDSSHADNPVTQVSYQDAIAYCRWAGVRLPSYAEYWRLVAGDNRPVISSAPKALPTSQVNIIGNVWDITSTSRSNGDIRLAGGSYLCNDNTCRGTIPDRKLYVDKTTGNIHIGFSVVR